MKTKRFMIFPLVLGTAMHCVAAESFYKEEPLFSTAPGVEKSVNAITRFGPVGMAIDLHGPTFTMWAGAIEPGSPAEAAGLQKGQIIESINGESLKDIDPRIQLGGIIEKAEAADGIMNFMVKDSATTAAKEVTVKIPVLGAYSKTWPLDCPKSDKIIRGFADYISKPESDKGFADAGMLFLLSTGDDKDLAAVGEWVHGLAKKKSSGYAWHLGFGGIPLCEYYLRTGDPEAMPVIQSWVEAAAKGEYLDAWAGRGGVTKLGYGNGHLNAGGTSVVTFLLLAKQCGAEVDDSLLQRTLVHFFRYAGRGTNPYGDDRPETSFVDNGKNGNLSFAMAAAASLTPDGENSVYARARDVTALTSFYTTTFMLHGHTGGGIGEIWRSASMALLHEKKRLQYREFMDNRKWHYEMSRRFDSSFGILGGAGYDKIEWGACYPWAYTFPRKTLRITGAPPSKFSKQYKLPEHPWGTAADEVFLSMESAAYKDGKRADISGETLAKDSAKPLIIRLNEKELTDDEIRRYVHHPEYLIRHMVSYNAAGLSCDYMFPKPGQRIRYDLMLEFCEDKDPRVRNAGFRAAIKAFDPENDFSKRAFHLAIERLKDDNESWWVKDACLSLIAQATPDMIVPQVDVILPYLEHQEQWLQNGALMALANVITDERCYAKVLPPVGELIQTTPRQSTTSGPLYAIRQQLPNATPNVRDLALKAIGDAYANYSGGDKWVGGQDLTGHRKETLGVLAAALAEVPGGLDVLYEVSKKQFPGDPLPHDEIFLAADPEKFGLELKGAILPLIREELIYQYIGTNRRSIFNDIRSPAQRGTVTNSIDGLVSLYNKIGVRDYDWKPFGPDLKNEPWNYFTFDPKEQQKYDLTPWRYRTVTYPAGMEDWFAKDFDPAKASWKKGQFPLGQFNGKLGDIQSPYNQWDATPRTLWEKEVLLVRGTFELPPAKTGHIYRLRVQTGQGVGAGDGFRVYINGKQLVEDKLGLGRRAGDNIRGGWITEEFTGEFGNGPVTLAATSFLKYGDRAIVTMPPVPRGIFSMWLEERQLPPLDDAVLRKAATFVPMFSSEWQAQNDLENEKPATDDDKFRYDGKFTTNPAVPGSWTTMETVAASGDFKPGGKPNPGRAPFRAITFNADGTTSESRWIWSGDTLMDLENSVALKITPQTIAGAEYLFIEAGGYSPKNSSDWKCPLMVLKKN
jgi:hypothetical protein